MNTNKIDLIKAEVEKIQLYTQSEVLKQVLSFIDSLEKEPVSKGLEEAIDTYLVTYFGGEKERLDWPFLKKMAIYFAEWQKQKDSIPVSDELKEIAWNYADKKCHLDIAVFTPDEIKKERGKMQFTWQDLYDAVMFGAKWQKTKDESTTEDLGDYINELSKQFPEVSFAKLSRIAVRVAKWQKQKDSIPVSEELEDTTQTITYEGEVYTRCYKDKLDAFACKYPMLVPKTSKRYAKYSDVDLTIAVKKGAQWQKEQMEKNAFYITCCGAHMFSAIWCIDNMDTSYYKAGDRLKIIIVKED